MGSARRQYLGQITVALILIGVCLLFLALTFTFPHSSLAGNDAAMVPRLWVLLMLPLCVHYLVRLTQGKESPDGPSGRLDKALGVALVLILSVAGTQYIGYYICSAAFIWVCMYMLGLRGYLGMTVIALGWVAFSYFVFYRTLYVPLPAGIWIQALIAR